jgi:HD-like signal output (HDOD) protein
MPSRSENPRPILNEVSSSDVLKNMVLQSRSIYSLPAVAAEVLRLTANPKVDIRALKECIEHDPATVSKLLRVVNSSLFGLSREVGDLNQAIALLGIKPLKLLVLGFSLPDGLFIDVAREQLDWYWSITLIRAVAARQISEQIWKRPGDDAFLAGLLQDVGVLVLMRELHEPYIHFLQRVIAERRDLHQLEIESVGFDHTELSALLLESWNMPELLVQAIAQPRQPKLLSNLHAPHAELSQILHLADLMAQLVGQHRLDVLPMLLETGGLYCQFDKEMLNHLVADLQPKVYQLADVLSLQLPKGTDYSATLIESQQRISELVETVVGPLSCYAVEQDSLCDEVLSDVDALRPAVGKFLNRKEPASTKVKLRGDGPVVRKSAESTHPDSAPSQAARTEASKEFMTRLTAVLGRCRASRRGLSLVLLAASGVDLGDRSGLQLAGRALEMACRNVDHDGVFVESDSPVRRLIVLPDCERSEAISYTHGMFKHLHHLALKLQETNPALPWTFCAGVASVGIPPKNFAPDRLLETAERCLGAAQQSIGGTVKSLEIC